MLGNIACLTFGMWVGYDLICNGYLTKEILMLFFYLFVYIKKINYFVNKLY